MGFLSIQTQRKTIDSNERTTMFTLLDSQDVLRIINRDGPDGQKTLWKWYARFRYFPPPSNPHAKNLMWTENTVRKWLKGGIAKMYQDGFQIPEMANRESAIAYRQSCKERLAEVLSEIAQGEAELEAKRKKQERILRVYRKPVVATA